MNKTQASAIQGAALPVALAVAWVSISAILLVSTSNAAPVISQPTQSCGRIDTPDAIGVAQHFLQVALLTGCPLTAADAVHNGSINTQDVLATQRFYLGFTSGIASAGTDAGCGLCYGDVTVATNSPLPGVTVSLPTAILDTSVPISTVIILPVVTTNIDPGLGLIGFQGDFTFDERVVTFSPANVPVAPAGLTASMWIVSGNILPGVGPFRTLRVSAFSNDVTTPISGSGTLFNLKGLRVSSTSGDTSHLVWTGSPDDFEFVDTSVNTFSPAQDNGVIAINFPVPTPCGSCTPTPTPTPTPTAHGKIVFTRSVLTSVPPSPTPSEDGTQISQMDSNGANVMWLTFTDGNHPSRFSPKWSVDGNKILYLEANRNPPGPPFFLYYIIANGFRISIGEPSGGAGWSPDGTKVVFSEFGHIYVVNQDGSNRTNLNQNGSHPAWAPDGTKIAFDISGQIWTMNPDGSNSVSVTTNQDSKPAWSPDATKIAFVSSRDGNPEVYVMDANGSNQTRLTTNSNYEDSPSWSPDGAQLVFASQRIGDYARQIYTMNADGSNQSRITNNTYVDTEPSWQGMGTIFPTPTPPPTPTPLPLIAISGTVVYCSNPTPVPVPNVVFSIIGDASGTTLTDGSGNYSFSGLVANGNYLVQGVKAALAPSTAGITTTDVIAEQRHFLGQTLLIDCPFAAGDTNSDGNINTLDVIAIQRFFLGNSTGIANVGKYLFFPGARSYSNPGSNQTNQNYNAVIFGDVAAPFVSP